MLSLLCSCLLFQAPGPPQDPTLVRLDAGITVTRAEYLEHLFVHIGHARLEELVLDRILAKEVAALDPVAIPAGVRQGLADPTARARELETARVRDEFGGDRAAYERALRDSGVLPAQALRASAAAAQRADRIAALVLARRQPDEKALRRLFDTRYGVDGLRVVVRHVFCSFGKAAAGFRERHLPAPEQRIEELVRARAQALWEEHLQGVPFAELVAKGSDDPEAVRMAKDPREREHAGLVPGYNVQHFGVEFAAAVRRMQPGEVLGPVRTTFGYHILKLESAERTEFAAVRAELVRLRAEEPPSLAEQRLLLEELQQRYRVAECLPK